MRVLIVAGTYAGDGPNPWLLDDLAREFARAGHTVDVIAFDPTGARPKGPIVQNIERLSAYSVGSTKIRAGPLQKLLGYIQSGIGLHREGFRIVRGNSYDLTIYTSIASFSWGFPARVRRAGIAKKLVLILWDFFPIHQLEIGRINKNWLSVPLKAIERAAIRRADVVALMSPANERFFRVYHRGLKTDSIIIPPWSSSGMHRFDPPHKKEKFTVVFGGQLAKGRGVDTLLKAAALLQASDIQMDIVIAGEGSERVQLSADADRLNLQNVFFVGQLPRYEYRAMLATAHAGIAITVAGVTPPSFPSKIVEYCGLGLPVIVSVEPSSDAGDLVERHNAGISVSAGDVEGLAEALRTLHSSYEAGSYKSWQLNSRALYASELSTSRAVQRIAALNRDSDLLSD